MRFGAIIIGLLLAAELSLSASAAPAIAITEAPIIQHVVAPLSEHAPPADIDDLRHQIDLAADLMASRMR